MSAGILTPAGTFVHQPKPSQRALGLGIPGEWSGLQKMTTRWPPPPVAPWAGRRGVGLAFHACKCIQGAHMSPGRGGPQCPRFMP